MKELSVGAEAQGLSLVTSCALGYASIKRMFETIKL